MVQAVWIALAAAVLAVLSPAVLLSPAEAETPPGKLLIIEQPQTQKEELTLTLQTGRQVVELPLEEYLVGVVLSEMPASFEPEALKAQAVAARTFALGQMERGKHPDVDLCDQSGCCQAWIGQAALEQKLGDGWKSCWNKAEGAVLATRGQILRYEGQLIDAVYFSCSGGTTEDAVAVWGGQVPYLQSVKSPGEEQAAKYESQVTVGLEKFRQIILDREPQARLEGKPAGWFGSVTRTRGGGVDTMKIGGCSFTGTDLRGMFGLNSTNFAIGITADDITFSVRGYGHRVGMSQYGANAMAQAGKTCEQILQHYYTGAELCQIE